MTDKEQNKNKLIELGKGIQEYLEKEKVWIPNSERFNEVKKANKIAEKMFSDFTIEVTSDPLQTGALVINLTGDYIECTGSEIVDFKNLISDADNFEIYTVSENKLKMDIMFYGALKKI